MKPERPRSKSRKVFPARRKAPKCKYGDDLTGAEGNGHHSSTEAAADLTPDPFALFTEWDSEADHRAYDQL
ncbi:transcriptional regulator [Aurantimonas sp. HBX-1]|uniref:transcriptional regulator n=1 Tax=Aurantimonas sp. HBX-1 TaxID=2906072 RepID=UPI001F1F03BA|nr:transcriptional regulator [Aurantimonas sp. HBX-1]UIJ72310.1 transcriptional regulator [Aurantimonas sp. HBX-1]